MSVDVWTVNSPMAVSEIIDGELVVINLEKGSYYCSLGVGAFLWRCLEQRASLSTIEAAIVDGYGIAREQARADVEAFAARLEREGLIRPARSDEPRAASLPAVPGDVYVAPELMVYSDMQDLLLLDPIHDVSDEGWPTRAVDPSA